VHQEKQAPAPPAPAPPAPEDFGDGTLNLDNGEYVAKNTQSGLSAESLALLGRGDAAAAAAAGAGAGAAGGAGGAGGGGGAGGAGAAKRKKKPFVKSSGRAGPHAAAGRKRSRGMEHDKVLPRWHACSSR